MKNRRSETPYVVSYSFMNWPRNAATEGQLLIIDASERLEGNRQHYRGCSIASIRPFPPWPRGVQ